MVSATPLTRSSYHAGDDFRPSPFRTDGENWAAPEPGDAAIALPHGARCPDRHGWAGCGAIAGRREGRARLRADRRGRASCGTHGSRRSRRGAGAPGPDRARCDPSRDRHRPRASGDRRRERGAHGAGGAGARLSARGDRVARGPGARSRSLRTRRRGGQRSGGGQPDQPRGQRCPRRARLAGPPRTARGTGPGRHARRGVRCWPRCWRQGAAARPTLPAPATSPSWRQRRATPGPCGFWAGCSSRAWAARRMRRQGARMLDRAARAGEGGGRRPIWGYCTAMAARGCRLDILAARDWFERAATAGDGWGATHLARLLSDGNPAVPDDPWRAFDLYRAADARGIPAATHGLAIAHWGRAGHGARPHDRACRDDARRRSRVSPRDQRSGRDDGDRRRRRSRPGPRGGALRGRGAGGRHAGGVEPRRSAADPHA